MDVLYGPFSAAYAGNSVGAVVDYVTRMPTQFEAHGQVSVQHQPFDLYGTNASRYFTTDVRVRYQISKQASAAVGIDNLNNYQFWNFHPYPQRTYMAELKWTL